MKKLYLSGVIMLLVVSKIFAQRVGIDTKIIKNAFLKYFIIILLIGAYQKLPAQNVGIGTTSPNATAVLHVDAGTSLTRGFLVTGTKNLSAVWPTIGAGARMMFYPAKCAFRAGYATSTEWDGSNVGIYSVAIGNGTSAGGQSSVSLGESTTASSNNTVAIGTGSIASFSYATAIGSNVTASGGFSTAIGDVAVASGEDAFAFGYRTTASGDYSTAMGYKASTNNQMGAFVIGDSDPNNQGVVMPGLPDLFVARFNNGYYLQTSGYTSNIGVQVGHNGNAWVSICDINMKENFEPLNGEDVLKKMSKIKFSSWNYKKQDPKIYRHYGIMAQDFYKAFGHDNFGTIGNDTTVNPIDMIGIDMTAIQALEKRTEDLKNENIKLKDEVTELNARLKRLEDLQKSK